VVIEEVGDDGWILFISQECNGDLGEVKLAANLGVSSIIFLRYDMDLEPGPSRVLPRPYDMPGCQRHISKECDRDILNPRTASRPFAPVHRARYLTH